MEATDLAIIAGMVARWHAKLERGDPYYNPNLSRFHEDLRLGFDR